MKAIVIRVFTFEVLSIYLIGPDSLEVPLNSPRHIKKTDRLTKAAMLSHKTMGRLKPRKKITWKKSS